MFVGTPRDGSSDVFGRSSRARSNTVCNRHVSLGGPHSNQRHAGSLLYGQVPLIIGFESAVPQAGQSIRALAELFGFVPKGLEFRSDRVVVCHRIRRRKLFERLMGILQSA
jgi:hypothetical protein